jgi:hypothetical protein
MDTNEREFTQTVEGALVDQRARSCDTRGALPRLRGRPSRVAVKFIAPRSRDRACEAYDDRLTADEPAASRSRETMGAKLQIYADRDEHGDAHFSYVGQFAALLGLEDSVQASPK